MDVYYDDVKTVMNQLTDTIDGFGNAKLNMQEKIALSDELAEFCQLVRSRYELTSGYYVQSEYKALKMVSDIKDSKTVLDRMKISLSGNAAADFTAQWIIDWNGNLVCSSCNRKSGLTKGITNFIPVPSNFCPNCGKRMINANLREKVNYDG